MSEQAILNQQPLQTESTDGSNSKQTTNLISSHHATTVLDHDSTVYQLAKHLDDLLSKVGYGEIWNVELTPWIEGYVHIYSIIHDFYYPYHSNR